MPILRKTDVGGNQPGQVSPVVTREAGDGTKYDPRFNIFWFDPGGTRFGSVYSPTISF